MIASDLLKDFPRSLGPIRQGQLALFDRSTAMSWFWAFLFGPLYFLAHGFFAQAGIALLLAFIAPFFLSNVIFALMAYPAWRKRAEDDLAKAKRLGDMRLQFASPPPKPRIELYECTFCGTSTRVDMAATGCTGIKCSSCGANLGP